MSLYEKIKDLTQEIIENDELDEMSVTGNLDGGSGPVKTPKAFKKSKKYKVKNSDKPFSNKTESKFKSISNNLFLGEVTYRQLRYDKESTPKQTVNKRLKEINRLIYELQMEVNRTKKLKLETGIDSGQYWKTTEAKMIKMKERLTKIVKDIIEINS